MYNQSAQRWRLLGIVFMQLMLFFCSKAYKKNQIVLGELQNVSRILSSC